MQPNPASMMNTDENEGEDIAHVVADKYVASRISAVPYDEVDVKAAKKAAKEQKKTKKLVSGSLMKELRDEFSDRPVELAERDVSYDQRDDKRRAAAAERKEFEENNFIRLTLSKKERKQGVRRNEQHELTEFAHVKGYENDHDEFDRLINGVRVCYICVIIMYIYILCSKRIGVDISCYSTLPL